MLLIKVQGHVIYGHVSCSSFFFVLGDVETCSGESSGGIGSGSGRYSSTFQDF